MEKSRENKIYRAIGLMSGTAMDGIDAALIETDGYGVIRRIGFESEAHDPALRDQLRACLNRTDVDAPDMVDTERAFTMAHLPIIERLLDNCGYTYADIDVIGFHGQTTHHDPDKGLTIQLGDGELLAQKTGVDVVYDLRKADMKNGGQGAPFLPVYHRALAMQCGVDFPVVVANIGGVGNITWMNHELDDQAHAMIAFDTGPGNALMDDFIQSQTGATYDDGGEIAATGKADEGRVQEFLSLPYFAEPYPKSLDRNDFPSVDVSDLSLEDGLATLLEMTARSIALGVEQCPKMPTAIYVTGGGRHNKTLMARLSDVLGLPVDSVDVLGWNGDSVESEGFAYMAVRSLLGEPISFPGTTGCVSPTIGGVLVGSQARAA